MAKTVLIVEDDRNIADLLRLYLEKEGYTVVIAPETTPRIVGRMRNGPKSGQKSKFTENLQHILP